jgi:hypothetical protein
MTQAAQRISCFGHLIDITIAYLPLSYKRSFRRPAVSRGRWKTGKSVEETWFVELDQEERVRRLTARHLQYDQDAAIAEVRTTGNDETNAALVAPGARRSTLVITNSNVKEQTS